MFFAMGLVLLIFILPALAISWVVPAQQLSLTAGVMQAFSEFFGYFGTERLVPIVAIALVCASAGGMLTWLAGPVEGPAADRAARGLPAAVLPAAERERVPGQHPRRPGRGHDRDRAAVRADPVGVERLLDPQRDDDAGLPDRLPADVHRGGQPAPRPAQRRARLPAPALKLLCVVGFLASAAAILIGFVPPSQFENGSDGGLRRADPGRHGAARAAAAVAVPEVPKAELEVRRRGGDVMSAAGSPDAGASPRRPSHDVLAIGAVVVALFVDRPDHLQRRAGQPGGAGKARSSRRRSRRPGLRVPGEDMIVNSLGDDGGAVCDNPANALGKAALLTRSPTARRSSAAAR